MSISLSWQNVGVRQDDISALWLDAIIHGTLPLVHHTFLKQRFATAESTRQASPRVESSIIVVLILRGTRRERVTTP